MLNKILNTAKKYLPLYLLPTFVFAQSRPGNFEELVNLLVDIINRAMPVLISLALLVFFWGLARFMLNAGGGKEREDAKNIILWGIIIIFILFSLWGIIRILQATFIP